MDPLSNASEMELRVIAAGTLLAGIGVAFGIMRTAQGRSVELYPYAMTGAVMTAFISAAYALGGDRPARLRP